MYHRQAAASIYQSPGERHSACRGESTLLRPRGGAACPCRRIEREEAGDNLLGRAAVTFNARHHHHNINEAVKNAIDNSLRHLHERIDKPVAPVAYHRSNDKPMAIFLMRRRIDRRHGRLTGDPPCLKLVMAGNEIRPARAC